jgi:oligosaccharyl transferase (archaeosortase A-associated)
VNKVKLSPQLITCILVALFVGVALYFRIAFAYSTVFVGDLIKFTGTDSWYHMRIIDNLVHNFPDLNSIDPYLLYPVPMGINVQAFFDYVFAVIILILGLGTPTQQTVDLISAYLPAVLGALVVIPVYFIGKALINRWVGVIAAGLIALSPGEFLGRSLIGQADHHVFEVLCSSIGMLFIILALKDSRQKQITISHLRNQSRSVIIKPFIYSLMAGVVLGIYLNSWIGALLFTFLFFVYLIIQFIIDYSSNINSDYLCYVGSVVFIITLLTTALLPHSNQQLAALALALVTTIIFWLFSRFLSGKGVPTAYYVLTLAGFVVLELAIFYLVNAGLFNYMLSSFASLIPTGARQTIQEAEGILFPNGEFSFMVVWLNYTTGSLLGLIALGILIYFVIKNGEDDKTLFVIWCLGILVITLSMRRFSYYFAVNVAILTAYFSWIALRFFGFKDKTNQQTLVSEDLHNRTKQKKPNGKEAKGKANSIVMTFGLVLVFLLVIFPNIIYAKDNASTPQFAPDDAWCESLNWLRNNTPDPFGAADSYYKLYERDYKFPASAYGIAAHWDYGYWITRLAHRAPISNPGITGNRESVAKYFLAKDEQSAIASTEAKNSKYIIVDYDTAMPIEKYYSWLEYVGIKQTEYYDVFVQRSSGKPSKVLLYYPEYYSSLVVRLYNFDGSQVVFQEPVVISYELRSIKDGGAYKEITSWQSFSSYEKALAYVDSQSKQKPGNYRIVGTSPFISPIPMNSLKSYKLVYSSSSSLMVPNIGKVPEVKIFEYIR